MTRIAKTDSTPSLPQAPEENPLPTTKEITAKLTQLFKEALKNLAEEQANPSPPKRSLEKTK